MADHKVTFFFRGSARGWTESFAYRSPTGVHDDTLKEARRYASKRSALLGKECLIHAIRISTDGIGPDALLHYEDFEGKFNAPQGPFNPAELPEITGTAHPDVALLIRCSNVGNSAHKHIFLRGIWDKIEEDHGRYRRADPWLRFYAVWRSYLEAGGWGWFGVLSKTRFRLASVVRGADDRATFTFTGNLFAADLVGKTQSIRISRVNKGKSNLNVTHIVEVLSQNSARTEGVIAISNVNTGGWGAWQQRGFIPIVKAADQKVVTRETGAPLLESAGRRKAQARG